MVPLNARKDIALMDAENLTLTSANPAIAEVVGNVPLFGGPSNRRLTTHGKQRGHTFIEVRKNNVVQTKLEVSVKQPLKKTLAFWFVTDAPDAGGVKRATERNPSEAAQLITRINEIYTPQTNIEFVSVGAAAKTLTKSLGEEITFDADLYAGGGANNRSEWDTVMAVKVRTADIHIFFVWTITCEHRQKPGNCVGYHAFKNILIENLNTGIKGVAEIAAHEVGHALGVVSHLTSERNDDYLMFERTRGGTRIPKIHANILNGPF